MFLLSRTLHRASRLPSTLAGLALLLAAAAPLRAQTPVEFGDTISEPGLYFLHGNQAGSGTGIKIESGDVTLLLSRFTLRGDGSDAGIFCSGYDNVVIYGGRITNFKIGIFLGGAEYCTVKDTRVDHCTALGIDLAVVDESSFLRLRVDHNEGPGIAAVNCYANRFLSILSHDNDGDGIAIANEVPGGGMYSGNKVRLCWAAYNGRDGIRIRDSHDNDLVRNQCVGNDGAGIRLDASGDDTKESLSLGGDEAVRNTLMSNWCVFNREGIVVEWNARENTLTNNTALANSDHDMVDDNAEPPCVNTWFLNFFLTKDGDGEDCIF